MAKAEIQVKTKHTDGDIHSVEIFFLKGGIVIHRHVLTDNEEKAKAWNKYRKFWNKWYTMQQVVITLPEIKSILKAFILHPVTAFNCFKTLK